MFKSLFKQKRGVSPLIATVLLIAFAVALGAIVMTWGENYVRTTADFAKTQSDVQLQCTSDVYFSVNDVSYYVNATDGLADTLDGGLNITIENNRAKTIKGFMFVVRDEDGRGITADFTSTKKNASNDLTAFQIKTYYINNTYFEDTGLDRVLNDIKVIGYILPNDDPKLEITACDGNPVETEFGDGEWPLEQINFTTI